MKRLAWRWTGLLLLLVLTGAVGVWAQATGSPSPSPSSSPESDTVKQMVASLDAHPEKLHELHDTLKANPYGPLSMSIISIMAQYGQASSKVTVTLGSLIEPLSTPKHEDTELRLFGEYLTSLILYATDHEGKAGDTEASNRYAINNVLTAYHNMLKVHPDRHNAYADKLLALKHEGKLEAYIHDEMQAAAAKASASPSTAASSSALPAASETPDGEGTPDGKSTGQL